jgi:hypothetical protein
MDRRLWSASYIARGSAARRSLGPGLGTGRTATVPSPEPPFAGDWGRAARGGWSMEFLPAICSGYFRSVWSPAAGASTAIAQAVYRLLFGACPHYRIEYGVPDSSPDSWRSWSISVAVRILLNSTTSSTRASNCAYHISGLGQALEAIVLVFGDIALTASRVNAPMDLFSPDFLLSPVEVE